MADEVAFPAAITLEDYSQLIGTTSVQVLMPGQLKLGVRYLKLAHHGVMSNSPYIWYSFTGPAAPWTPGSYPLPMGRTELYQDSFVPANGLWAIASAADTLFSVIAG